MKYQALLDPFAAWTVRSVWKRDSRWVQLEPRGTDEYSNVLRGNAEYLNLADSPDVAHKARGKRGLLTETEVGTEDL